MATTARMADGCEDTPANREAMIADMKYQRAVCIEASFYLVPHCLFSSNGKLWRATGCEVNPVAHVVAYSSNLHGVLVLNCTLASLPHILPARPGRRT